MYYIYEVEIFNETSGKTDLMSGVIYAEGFTEAMEILDGYYDKEMIKVSNLYPLYEDVFEFNTANEDNECDYMIGRKPERRG